MSSDITNLPIEVIDLIFGHLTMANDRRRTAQVCKLFNKAIRSQSIRNRNNTLKLDRWFSGKSPFRTFEDWEILPFSRLSICGQTTWTQNIVMQPDFWSNHGHEISEISILISYNFNKEKSLMSVLSSYFPNLKKLIINNWNPNFDIGPNVQNTCSLPIEELYISILPPETILTFLRGSPHLKKVVITRVKPDLLSEILPWIESVEDSCLHFVKMPLAKLINLPSKVVIGKLTIQVAEKPKMIREFLKRPRMIETLILERQDDNLEFNEDEEEGENNPRYIFFNRDQVEALRGANSTKKVELPQGVLDFAGSLDLLAQLPGLESISFGYFHHIPDRLYPLYWSSSETAKKIHKVIHRVDLALDYLDGLSSLTTFSVPCIEDIEEDLLLSYENHPFEGLSSDEIQHLIRNCPNLKKLEVETILANDADLIGTGDLLPLSSLEKLEYLGIFGVPNITSEAFKSAFKFPNLKHFSLNYSSKPFNQSDAEFFTQNCPNVSELNIYQVEMNEDAFDYLIRNLPHLQKIYIDPEKQISEEKMKAIKKEFPYLNVGLGYHQVDATVLPISLN